MHQYTTVGLSDNLGAIENMIEEFTLGPFVDTSEREKLGSMLVQVDTAH